MTLSQLDTKSDIPSLSCLVTWKEDLNDSFEVSAVLLPVVINVENIEVQSYYFSFRLKPVKVSRRLRTFLGVEKRSSCSSELS